MAGLFNLEWDFAARDKEARAEALRQEQQRQKDEAAKRLVALGALMSANPTDQELSDYSASGGQLDPLRGVRGEDPNADIQAEARNEELTRAAQENAPQANAMRAAVLMRTLGINPAQVAQANSIDSRRAALERVLPALGTPEAQADAVNKLDVSPVRQGGGLLFNRFTGDNRETDALTALAESRRASAGLSDARARDVDVRRAALEDVLSGPTSPAVAADIVNKRPVSKAQRVILRGEGGQDQYFDAVPNLQGGFDYKPAASDGQPARPGVAGGKDSRTPLQRDTAFISETLGLPTNEALLYKLQTKRKSPDQAWADLVGRVVSTARYDDASEIQKKAKDLWAIVRPGEPLPGASSDNADAPQADAAQPGGTKPRQPKPAASKNDLLAIDAQSRAEKEGFSSFGNWVPGKGLEVFDDSGKLIGHYR